MPTRPLPINHPALRRQPQGPFANSAERTFAALLDLYEIAWVYEPVLFPLAWHADGSVAMGFRPDFFLPELGRFVELTVSGARSMSRKRAKIRAMERIYPEFPVQLLGHRAVHEVLGHHGISLREGAA